MLRRPPRPTPFPYTTLFRSLGRYLREHPERLSAVVGAVRDALEAFIVDGIARIPSAPWIVKGGIRAIPSTINASSASRTAPKIGRAHVLTPVTKSSPLPPSS